MLFPLKPVGCAMIIGCGILTALEATSRERKRLRVLDGWIALIEEIREQIECYLTPKSELLKRVSEATLRRCAADGILRHDPEELLQASKDYLDAESMRLLSTFLDELGNSYRTEQIRRCEHCQSKLQQIRLTLTAEIPRRIRIGAALRICAAIGISVLLW